MFKVIHKEVIGERFLFLKVHAPHVARAKVGQFLILQLKEDSERIPIFVLDTFQEGFSCLIEVVGRSSLEVMEEGEEFYYVGGPLGKPFPLSKYGDVLIYAKGWGVGVGISLAKALKDLGNSTTLIYFDEELSDFVKGSGIEALLEKDIKPRQGYNLVVSVGDNKLSKSLLEIYPESNHITAPKVHMLCSTGLCLTCRIKIEDKYLLACTDGAWFDAKLINWDDIISREEFYKEEEALALEEYKKQLSRKRLRGG